MINDNDICVGDCKELLKQLPENYVDLTITSPPYDNLRDYEGYHFDFQGIVKELFRVTKNGGIVVWVVGDSVINGSETGSSFKQALFFKEVGFTLHDTMIYEKNGSAFPARRDGNRYTQIFEYMFVFSKGKPRHVKLICDKKNKWEGWAGWGGEGGTMRTKEGKLVKRIAKPTPKYSPRNNIWRYATGAGYSTKDKIAHQHPAIFPEKLAEDHILTWSKENDLVLDPMCGSGTTCKMAKKNNRRFIGMDVSKEYVQLSKNRIKSIL